MANEPAVGKDLLSSWSFRGLALLVLSAVLQYFGYGPIADAELDTLIKVFEGLLPIVGTVLSIFGIVRRPDIVSVAKVKLPAAGKTLGLLLLLGAPLMLSGCGGCCPCGPRLPRLLPHRCFEGQCPAECPCPDGPCPEGECPVRDGAAASSLDVGRSTFDVRRSVNSGETGETSNIEHRTSNIEQFGAVECPDARLAIDLPPDVRAWYRNPDGSCVQCSAGMCGVDQNVPAAATLLWATEYGPAERGGSGSSRVSRYCKSRGIRVYNVTGRGTIEWMKWACRNGRGAAIGAGGSHFQTLMGHDPATNTWWVCNNNSTHKIDEYDDAAFRRLHAASGPWMFVLDYPPHAERPRYVAWWERPRQYR